MKRFSYLILCCLLLSACAQVPQRPDPVAASPEAEKETALSLPNVELSDELLYEYLLTEIASQRGHKALAAEGGADMTEKTRDPRLARRAAQLALESGDMLKSLDALRLWREIEPASPLAGRMLASMLLRGGKPEEAQPVLAGILRADAGKLDYSFLQIFQLLASYPDKSAALNLMRELAQPYPQVAEAHWAVAQLAQFAGDAPLGLSEIREARKLRPEWDMAAMLEAQLLLKNSPQQALEVLQRYLSSYPKAKDVRLQYARVLLEQKQYRPARDEFMRLAQDNPESPDLAFAIALISLQLNDLKGAETQLQQALNKGKKEQDTVQYYLGQLSEAKEDQEAALKHYREVRAGEHEFAARVRVAYLLSKRGKLDEARDYLHQAKAVSNQQRVQLLQVEAQLLREAQLNGEAFLVLQDGLKNLPNQPELLYEAAMLAEKLGKFDISESLLRKLIQNEPEHAHAHNALGYSLLERNVRIPEALALVEKALLLAPNDIAIIDSVGWGYYRSGRLDESVNMLRRAYAGNPDPEIAAHLGEVLWVRGDKDEASRIWQESLKAHPGNELLQAIIRKFGAP